MSQRNGQPELLFPLGSQFSSFALAASICLHATDIRVGIIGTDISHVIHFTRILNNAADPDHMAGARVVAAYKGGSPDIVSSRKRVDGFAEELKKVYGVEFVPDIPALCAKVDAIFLESGDGPIHLEQARPVIAAHKPLFIDKPLASTLEDAIEIQRLAKQAGVPWFSSSSLRFGQIGTTMKFADTTEIDVWGPGPMEEHHHLDLSWYAIHPIEMLYTLMGTGCEESRESPAAILRTAPMSSSAAGKTDALARFERSALPVATERLSSGRNRSCRARRIQLTVMFRW